MFRQQDISKSEWRQRLQGRSGVSAGEMSELPTLREVLSDRKNMWVLSGPRRQGRIAVG